MPFGCSAVATWVEANYGRFAGTCAAHVSGRYQPANPAGTAHCRAFRGLFQPAAQSCKGTAGILHDTGSFCNHSAKNLGTTFLKGHERKSHCSPISGNENPAYNPAALSLTPFAVYTAAGSSRSRQPFRPLFQAYS